MAVAWIIDRMRDAHGCLRPIWVAALEFEFTAGGVGKLMKLSVCYGEGCGVCAQLERNYSAKGKRHLICKWEDKCIYQDPLFVSMQEHLFFFVPQWKTDGVVEMDSEQKACSKGSHWHQRCQNHLEILKNVCAFSNFVWRTGWNWSWNVHLHHSSQTFTRECQDVWNQIELVSESKYNMAGFVCSCMNEIWVLLN